jgi:hypothetical protein
MAAVLCSCSSISYNEAKTSDTYAFGNGYFTVIKEWGETLHSIERIVYANDTGVMYYIFSKGYQGGITPLYNADGTLQIWEGE